MNMGESRRSFGQRDKTVFPSLNSNSVFADRNQSKYINSYNENQRDAVFLKFI